MPQKLILYPIFAMIVLTFAIAVRMLMFRFKAVREGAVSPAYFLLNRGGKLPDYLAKATQNFHNLLEMPPLFYTACLLAYATQHADMPNLLLAWFFVAMRCGHSYVHNTYNNLRHRRQVFLASAALLFALWARLFVQLLGD